MKTTVLLATILLTGATAWGADEPVLHLTNGGFVPGELTSSEQPTVLRWKSQLFTRPFDFSLEHVSAVHFAVPSTLPKPYGEYCLELTNGSVLFGDLLGLTEEMAELDAGRFGRLNVRRDQIGRLYRWNGGAELIYLGPNGLIGWTEPSATKNWREEGGQPTSDHEGASIRGDFGIPAQALIEFELSWKNKPGFVFALGVDDSDDDVVFKRAFRFEVWDNDLVVGCEQAREADVETVQEVRTGAGRIYLLAYLDQEKGKLLVYSPTGVPLAEVGVTPRKRQIYSGLRLENKRGDVRLDRLRISRWNGVPPREVQADKSRLHRTDGSIAYGRLAAYDAVAKQFTVLDDNQETKVSASEIASVFVSPPTDTAPSAFRAVYQDGTRIGGELMRVDDGYLHLKNPSIQDPVRLPLSELRSLVVQQRADPATSSNPEKGVAHTNRFPGPRTTEPSPSPIPTKGTGRLELDGVRLPGRLAAGSEQSDASCLVWHPEHSTNACPLVPGVTGRIVYREPAPPPRPKLSTAQQQQGVIVMNNAGGQQIVRVLRAPLSVSRTASTNTTTINAPKMMHLRSGDTIPCEVVKIDESGITFKTPLSDANFVSHDKVKALELGTGPSPPKLTTSKRDRLLTLPRLQKESPPTHLIPLKNGDFLRGRLVDMDDKLLRVEIRLENKEVPRDQVAQIIWLHADELSDTPVASAMPASSSKKTCVQALRSDGIRLTYFPEQFTEQTLSGTSDVLGMCRTDVSQVDMLLIGGAIGKAAADLVYHRWKLRHATSPKVALDDAASPAARTPGTESALVGKPAPAFELPLLGGKMFRLADCKGRVVVLDFWATWCGPCLQAMPQIDRVVREFNDPDVQLIAINLEESVKQITATLERHKLQMPVALDRDGAIAAKYEATAIPQTVVIDRDGKIARLFIGAGPHLSEQLREAIRELLSGNESNPSAQD